MKRLILCLIAVLFLFSLAYAGEPKVYTDSDLSKRTGNKTINLETSEPSLSYIDDLFVRIDREMQIGSGCKDIEPFLQRLSREYDNMDKKQKAKFDAINKVCQKKLCIERAEAKYKEAWKAECKNRGLNDNCSLNVQVANSLDETHRYDKTACKE